MLFGRQDDASSSVSSLNHKKQPRASVQERQPFSPNTSTSRTSSTTDRSHQWLPYTLRWPFLSALVALSLLLCITVAVLCAVSHRRGSLARDNDSNAVLLGWRFSPTIITVFYAQLVGMVFYDIAKTEPFAKMARIHGGAAAQISVLQATKPWWVTLVDGFRVKSNGGKLNVLLICASVVSMLSALVISPLSSSILISLTNIRGYNADFSRFSLEAQALSLGTSPETFFATTGQLFNNLSSSPWNMGKYTILPFWPADMAKIPSFDSKDPSGSSANWTASTKVISAEYSCSKLEIKTLMTNNNTFSAPATLFGSEAKRSAGSFMLNGTATMITSTIKSEDGCTYRIDELRPDTDLGMMSNRSFAWARWSDGVYQLDKYARFETSEADLGTVLKTSLNETWNINRLESGPTSPFLRFNASTSSECQTKDIILLTTRNWASTFSSNDSAFIKNYHQHGWSCSPNLQMAEVQVDVLAANGQYNISFDEGSFLRKKVPVPNDMLNISKVLSAFHSDKWSSFAAAPDFASWGSALVLSHSYNRSFADMTADDKLPQRAENIFVPFFAEVVQTSIQQQMNPRLDRILGRLQSPEKQIVVVREVGIILAVLFGLNTALFVAIFYYSRLWIRPLNLQSDPSSILNVAKLVAAGNVNLRSWRHMFLQSKKEMASALEGKTYRTSLDGLWESGETVQEARRATDPVAVLDQKSDWRPRILRIPSLFGLTFLLVCLLVGISVLWVFAKDSLLSATAFTHESTISIFRDQQLRFTPFSIIPTFIAVAIGLWWSSMQETICRLQTYVAIAHTTNAIGRTYNPSNWVTTFVKALRNKHFNLFLVVMGCFLCQLLTISSSALFERDSAQFSQSLNISRSLEPRQLPIRAETDAPWMEFYRIKEALGVKPSSPFDLPEYDPGVLLRPINKTIAQKLVTLSTDQLNNVTIIPTVAYEVDPQAWIYSSINQLVNNGSEPVWSHDGWSFTPVALADNLFANREMRISVDTPALRARTQCTPTTKSYNTQNTSSWLETFNSRYWNSTPSTGGTTNGRPTGYWLSEGAFEATQLGRSDFCLQNTSQTRFGGRWSKPSAPGYPYPFSAWPLNFTATWLSGPAQLGFTPSRLLQNDTKAQRILSRPASADCSESSTFAQNYGIFTEIPQFQSLDCQPVIEEANARVVVDYTGRVLSYNILNTPQKTDAPWKDVFNTYTHNTTEDNDAPLTAKGLDIMYITILQGTMRIDLPKNYTTSYGLYFMGSLLSTTTSEDPVNQKEFFLHDRTAGFDMDIMTYAIYTLANRDPAAFNSNSTLFPTLVSRVFSTLFQHFASRNASLSAPNWAFQPIGAEAEDLGRRLFYNRTEGVMRRTDAPTYARLNSAPMVSAVLEHRSEVLVMNAVATWLSVAILICLILSLVVVSVLQNRFLRPLRRNVECLADTMVLVAGSEKLIRLVGEGGGAGGEVLVRLGWFRDGADGGVRWGIEVVEGTEWVGEPGVVEREVGEKGGVGEGIKRGVTRAFTWASFGEGKKG